MWQNKVVEYTIPDKIGIPDVKKWLSKHLAELNVQDEELCVMAENIICHTGLCDFWCYVRLLRCTSMYDGPCDECCLSEGIEVNNVVRQMFYKNLNSASNHAIGLLINGQVIVNK